MSSDGLILSQASVSPVQEKTLTYKSNEGPPRKLVAGECGEDERAGLVQPAEDKRRKDLSCCL